MSPSLYRSAACSQPAAAPSAPSYSACVTMTRRWRVVLPQMSGGGRPGMVGAIGPGWSVRVRHVLWLLLLWMVCGLHLLYLFASYGVQPQAQLQEERPPGDPGGAGIAWRVGNSIGSGVGVGGGGGQWLHRERAGLSSIEKGLDRSGPWDVTLEEVPRLGHRLEGQHLRHLASDRGSLLSQSYAHGPSIHQPQADSQRTMRKERSVMSLRRTLLPVLKDNKVMVTMENVGLRSDYSSAKAIVNTPDSGSDNYTKTGNSDPQVSSRPETMWVACQSAITPPLEARAGPERRSGSGSGSGSGSEWQAVRLGQSYVFSAYLDQRPLIMGGKAHHGVLRIIGMTDTHVDGAPQFCQLWYAPQEDEEEPIASRNSRRRNSRTNARRGQYGQRSGSQQTNMKSKNMSETSRARLVIVPASSDIVPETHGLRFAPFIYTCRLGPGILPIGVSMTHSRCDSPLNYLRINQHQHPNADEDQSYLHHHRHKQQSAKNYTVCVTPFNFNYNNIDQFVEKVEVDRMFGANKFIFYNYSSGPDLARYIDSYVRQGVAEVVQWKLPVRVDTWPASAGTEVDMHYFGQLAALNDCLYRAMATSQMVIFSDMDELIVPHRHATWRQMVAFLQHKGQGTAGTFIFQNAFYRTEWPNDARVIGPGVRTTQARRIMSLAKVKRERYIYPWGMRSKFICDPLKVEMVGVHNIWRFVNDTFTELDVPSDVGLLHHYRSWNKPQEENSVVDHTMHAYFDVILSRVKARHMKVMQENDRTLLKVFKLRPGER